MSTPALPRPPGPVRPFFGLPFLREMKRDTLGFLHHLQASYGDASYLRIAWEHNYDFFHPDLAREVLVDKARSFIRWERAIEVFAEVHGQSVLVTEGNTWQRQRRMLQPGFALKRMAGYAQLMVASAAPALDALKLRAETEVNFEHEMTQLTMAVIMRTLFSSESPDEVLAAEKAVRIISHAGNDAFYSPISLPDWLPHKWQFRWAKRMLDGLIRRQIRLRREALAQGVAPKDDLLGMLLALRDEEGDSQSLNDEEVRDQCMTIFLAGHETTAAALTWWGWAMVSHPDCLKQATAEVDAVLGKRIPTYDDVAKLSYVSQSLRETLRRWPPAPILITRRAVEDVQIGAWHIPKGAMVRITPHVLHHDARWFAQPEQFKPERFAPEAAQQVRGSYLPFGTGPRVCIGNTFALMEMTLIAAMVLQRFRPEQVDAMGPEPVLNVTLRPKKGLPLRLLRRTTA